MVSRSSNGAKFAATYHTPLNVGYRKNKATFHASPPTSVSPSRARVPPGVPLSRPSTPAAGECGRRPGRPPGARHPLRAPGRRCWPGALKASGWENKEPVLKKYRVTFPEITVEVEAEDKDKALELNCVYRRLRRYKGILPPVGVGFLV